ncbi:MAG: hypothetical protein EAZ07_02530 [Cytophagales bacterium]|nr:MAG: hypothetical protein EAZ07_02530 [Cytophagales bacterium]
MKKLKLIIVFLCYLITYNSFSANYYWVGGSGNWSNFATHWATTSGGAGRHTQVPISTDDVFFDANSFTGNGQTVTINTNAVCRNMNWTNSGATFSGATNGPAFAGTFNIEIFGDLILDNRMRDVPFQGVLRMLSTGAATIDAKGVRFTHFTYDSKIRFENSGTWTFTSSFYCIGALEHVQGTVNLGVLNHTFGYYFRQGSSNATLNMNSSTATFVGPGRLAFSTSFWEVDNGTTNYTLNAGTSTIVLDFQNVEPFWAQATQGRAIFYGRGLVYNNITSTANTFLEFRGNNTVNNFTINGKAYIDGNNTIQNRMELAKGYEYEFNGNSTQTFSGGARILAVGDCQNYVYILSRSLQSANKANFTAASWAGSTIDYAIIFNTRFTVGITATNSVDNGLNSGITFPAQTVVSNFWRGGNGDWNDATKWSTGCVPTPNDNVFFDASSFTAPGQRVTISTKNAYCRNMNWTGATNNPELISTGLLGVSLNIHGSLTFIPAMTNSLLKPTNFWGSGAGNQITSAGQTFKNPIYFKGTGTYTLQDALEVAGVLTDVNTGVLYFNSGTLTTNNQTVKVRRFQSRDNGVAKTLNMGSSVFTINNNLSDGTWDNYVWWADPANMTIDAGTSTINVDNDGLLGTTRFKGGNGFTYYNLNFQDVENEPEIDDENDNTRFRSVTFAGNGKISSTINITHPSVASQIVFSAGKTYKIEAGRTVNLAANAVLLANGTCSNYINIQSTTTSQAFFSKTGAAVNLSFVTIQNIGVGTVVFNANPGLDLGGNSGWTFVNPVGRTLYWVGGTGNWNNPNNWSLSSGGAPGACPPTLVDDVNFDANSFTAAGQTVTINVNPASCKSMNWTGATNNPSLVSTDSPMNALSIYGSLTMISNMNINNFRGELSFRGGGVNTITSAGRVFGNPYINFNSGTGTYTMNDDFTTTTEDRYGRVNLVSGTLNTNGRKMFWNGFNARRRWNDNIIFTAPRTLILGNSRVDIYGRTIHEDWDLSGANTSFNAGTSNIFLPARTGGLNQVSRMGNFTYNNVSTVALDPANSRIIIEGNSTFNDLRLFSATTITGNNTVNDTMYFHQGYNYTYTAGTTQTFSAASRILAIGTSTDKILIQSSSSSPIFFVKPAGIVCTFNANIRYNSASGGAIWSVGEGPNLQPFKVDNPGWDDTPFEAPGSVTLSGNTNVCANTSTNLTFTLTPAYPKVITYTDGITNFTTGAINSSPLVIPVSSATTRTYSIVSVDVNVCVTGPVATSGTATVNIIVPPAITTQPSNNNICSGGNAIFTVTASGTALTYQWRENGVDIIDGGIYSGATSASLTLTGATVARNYTVVVTGSCGTATSNVASLTFKPSPLITNTLTAQLCSGGTTNISLTSNLAGSTFAWTSAPVVGITGNSNGNGTPISQLLNNSTNTPIDVTYVVTPSNDGCLGTPSNVVVTVNPIPTISNSLLHSICSGQTTSINLTSPVAGATFAWTSAAVTNITGNANGSGNTISQTLTNSTNASINVTYVVTPSANTCLGTSANVVVTVNPIPTITNALTANVCSESSTNIALTSNVGGATFSWTSAAVVNITGNAAGSGNTIAQTLTNSTNNNIDVTYVVTPRANTCDGTASNVVVTVKPKPTVTNPLTSVICSGEPTAISLTSGVAGTTFSWVSAPVGNISGNSNGTGNTIIQTLTNGTNVAINVSYVITPTANFCSGNTSNLVLTVNPKPSISNSLVASICSESSTAINLTSTVLGSTFAWTSAPIAGISGNLDGTGNTISQTLTNSTNASINVTYIVTPTANSCIGNASSIIVTVLPKPNVSNSLTASICSGNSTNINLTSNVTGTTFAWTTSAVAGVSGNSNGSGGSIVQGLTNTTSSAIDVVYQVTPTANSCSGNAANVVVTVIPRPTITNPLVADICSGSATAINLTSNITGATFTWTSPSVTNITGNSNGNGNAISQTLTNASNLVVTVNYLVTATANTCAGNPTNIAVSVNPTPNVTSANAYSICSGNTTAINLTSDVVGATYTWTSSPVVGIVGNADGSGSAINQGLSNNTDAPINIIYSVTPTANSCLGNIQNITVTVNPRPSLTNSLVADICSGGTTNISLSSNVSGATFTWTSAAVVGISGNSNSNGALIAQTLTNSTSNPIDVNYSVTATANNCPTSPPTNIIVTVNPIPTLNSATNFTICSGETTNIPLTSSTAGATFSWTSPAVVNISGNSNGSGNNISQQIDNNAKTSINVVYTVTPTANLCLGVASNITVLVRPIPTITRVLKDSICSGSTTNTLLTSDVAGVTYSWTTLPVAGVSGNSNGTGNPIAQSLTNTNSVNSTVTYSVTPIIATCNGTPSDIIVTVYPTTVAGSVSGGTSICEGSSSNPLLLTGNTGSVQRWEFSVSPFSSWTAIAFTGTAYTSPNLTQTTRFRAVIASGLCSPSNSGFTEVVIIPGSVNTGSMSNGGTICAGSSANILNLSGYTGTFIRWEKSVAPFSTWDLINNITDSYSPGVLTETTRFRAILTSGSCASANSPEAIVVVNTQPIITTQPIAPLPICESAGDDVFSVTATGTALTYQWRENGVNITNGGIYSNATTNTLTLINPPLSINGRSYDVVITGTCGSITSNAVVATINAETRIVSSPPNPTIVCEGSGTTFAVIATGTNLTYQWREDANDLTNAGIYNNVNTSVLSLAATTLAMNNRNYDVLVTGTCGNATSSQAILKVNQLTVVSNQPINQTICEGIGTTFTIDANGTNLGYQWRENGNILSDNGIFSGSNTSTLVLSSTSLLMNNNKYDVLITGTCGNITSLQANLAVNALTNIMAQPLDKTICEGLATTFEVNATGSGLSYQWRVNGVNISNSGVYSDANTPILQISSGAQSFNGNQYDVVITGLCSNASSSKALLSVSNSVVISSQPINDTVCSGGLANFNVVASGSGLSYQWRENGINISNNATFSGATSNSLNINSPDISFDGRIYDLVINGTCGNNTSTSANLVVKSLSGIINQPNNLTICEGNNASFSINAGGVNITYQWKENGNILADGLNYSGTNTNQLTINNVSNPFNNRRYEVAITSSCGNLNSSLATLTVNSNPSISAQPRDTTICNGQNAVFSVNASGTGLQYQWAADGNNIVGATNASLTVLNATTLLNAVKYRVAINGTCGNLNSNEATLTVNPSTVINRQPNNAIICENSDTLFTINATGTNLSYQWRKNNTNILSETNDTIKIVNALLSSNNDEYDVIVSGTCGNVTSSKARLTINRNTRIESQPINTEVCQGANANFLVSASGTNLSYQWRENGNTINNQTNTSITIINTNIAQNNSLYDLVVTGACGQVITNKARLTVNQNTTITANPQGLIVCEGTNALFSVAASGTNVTYQWRENGVNLQSQTTPSYTLVAANPNQSSNRYDVIVSGLCGNLTSSVANLIVNRNTFITLQPKDTIVCAGVPVRFSSLATGSNLGYQWRVNGQFLLGENAPILNIANTNINQNNNKYEVVISGTCGNINSTIATLTVNANAIAGNLNGAGIFCEGTLTNDLRLIGHVGAISRWESSVAPFNNWITISNTTSSQNISNLTTTTHFRAIIQSGTCPIAITAPAIVEVQSKPTIADAGLDLVLCDKETFIKANIPSVGQGRWSIISGADGIIADEANPQSYFSGRENTTYKLRWTITNGICKASQDSINIEFRGVVKAKAPADTTIKIRRSIELKASGSTNYSWSPAAYLSNPNISNPIAKPDVTTTYIVTVSDDFGCFSSDTVVITVDDNISIKIPNTFSPNSDNEHDFWIIENAEYYPQASLDIFNRWGQVIRNIRGGENMKWDGKNNNGADMEVGTYFYIFKEDKEDSGTANSITIVK